MKVNFEKREGRVDGCNYKSKVQLVKKTGVSSNSRYPRTNELWLDWRLNEGADVRATVS